jgi:hypothetical protein
MKKLLVLMLVLGMASIANATTVTWSVDSVTINSVGGIAVVQLEADDTAAYPTKWVGASGASTIATISSIVARAAAGPDHVIKNPTQTTYPGWWTVEAADMDPDTWDIATGAQYDVTITGLAIGTHQVVADGYATVQDWLEITVLPEPTTVALLGLGGLFLLRRRK